MEYVNLYLLAVVMSWLIAHVCKFIIARIKGERVNFINEMFVSGGMPSSHAASSVAMWAMVLFYDGYKSGLFAVASLFALIVCYDAVKVRRSSGEQGETIRKMIKMDEKRFGDLELPRSAKGHTPVEVFAGAILGLVVACVVFIATK